ncbi:hypothetical protein [Bradyrhizobium neotropicale]|uniref:hypothetical protein n=1 Tax=Bradyrhizobium neotropicale TaxID=1497615 RepID=UPI001AD7CA3A|nr:hypothetical protein [Bradyrhizobium neotropicale]MBO4226951.1 hypothetical protein [Bradyrhizobium neotropicale]
MAINIVEFSFLRSRRWPLVGFSALRRLRSLPVKLVENKNGPGRAGISAAGGTDEGASGSSIRSLQSDI